MKMSVDTHRIREHLRTLHSDSDLRAWFDPLQLTVLEPGVLEVRFPHRLFSKWFGIKHQKQFEREIVPLLGSFSAVVFTKPEPVQLPILKYNKPLPHTLATPSLFGENGKYSFDTFIYNKKNEFPVSLAKEFASSTSNAPYVPFVICGRGNCGKTHLLRAMAGTMAAMLPFDAVYFGTVEEAEVMYRESPTSFTWKMLQYKAVFIDNGQNLSLYPELQQQFVFIAEKFKEKRNPLILAIDDSADQSALNPQLRARLESGLSVTVKQPDLDVRLRYAKAQCGIHQVSLKKDFLLSIAQRFTTLTTIQGIIVKASAFQHKTGKTLTLADMEKLLAGTDALIGKRPTTVGIINQVADSLSLLPEDITGNDRRTEVVRGRHIAIYLCRKLLGVPYSSLGAYFGGKNHATIIYTTKKIEKMLKIDKDMHKLVTKIQKKFLTTST